MSNYQPAVSTSGRPPRPAVVSAAGYMLYALPGLFTISAIISLSTISQMLDAVTDDVTGQKSAVEALIIGLAVVKLVAAALCIVLAVFVLRGSNGMRVTTWVIAGIGALSTLCAAANSSLTAAVSSSQDDIEATPSQRMLDAVPTWARTSSILIDVIIVILFGLVIILLALRSSNDFFRYRPAMVVGYPGYPAYPGYPQPSQPVYPGQPVYPQAPAAPPAPPSEWALPGGVVPTQPGPVDGAVPLPPGQVDGTMNDDVTRPDPNQS